MLPLAVTAAVTAIETAIETDELGLRARRTSGLHQPHVGALTLARDEPLRRLRLSRLSRRRCNRRAALELPSSARRGVPAFGFPAFGFPPFGSPAFGLPALRHSSSIVRHESARGAMSARVGHARGV